VQNHAKEIYEHSVRNGYFGFINHARYAEKEKINKYFFIHSVEIVFALVKKKIGESTISSGRICRVVWEFSFCVKTGISLKIKRKESARY
jgi:hypothetical protein